MNASKSIRIATVAIAIVCNPSAFAIQYDLVNNNTQTVPGTGGSAIFDKAFLQTSGTGAIDPFLRVHDNDNFEQGFNTSNPGGGNPDGFNAINGVWTHDLLLSSLKIVTHNGGSYYQFLLDLGEPSGGSQVDILLNKFNLYTGNTAAPTFAGISGNPDNLGTKRFDMAGNTILFVDESSGNGQSDVLIFVPTAAFAGVTDTYLYLYTELGYIGDNNDPRNADGTFEEFAALEGPNPNTPTTPDGGTTLMLLGASFAVLGAARRFIKR